LNNVSKIIVLGLQIISTIML